MSVVEKAVVLHNVGRYICDAAGDHICDQNATSITIDSKASCVENREYILAADGETGIPCSTIKSNRKIKKESVCLRVSVQKDKELIYNKMTVADRYTICMTIVNLLK